LPNSSKGKNSSDDEDFISKNEAIVTLDDKMMKESMKRTKRLVNKEQKGKHASFHFISSIFYIDC
jgi:dTDP-glucose pyrophosphorylase